MRTYPSKRISRKRGGLSLMELLAVITIMGVIAAVVIPRIISSKKPAEVQVNEQNIAEINSTVERWYFEKGTWPADDLADIKLDTNYFPDGVPKNPVDKSNYLLDSVTHRVKK